MWTKEVVDMILKGIQETLYMTLLSTLMGYVIGLPMGVLLAVSDKDGLKPNRVLYRILDVIANIVRSIPFLILLILLIPFTRMIVGKSYGSTATVVPLVIAAGPFIARMVESSLKEVDEGVIEAARSMGASNLRIIVKVLLVEARTSLINDCSRNHPGLLSHGRNHRRRRTGRYRDPIWLSQVSGRYHDRYRCTSGHSGTDFPDGRNHSGQPTGQEKIVIKKII